MQEVKGISELFAWQAQCLLSSAVQNRQNLLYSLPTSGGEYCIKHVRFLQLITEKIAPFVTFFRQSSGGGDYYAAGAALLQVRKQEVFLIFIIFVPNYRYVS